MKVILTESQFNRVILKEGWYDEEDTYYSGDYPDESVEIIDYDKVLRDMKFKFGWGDISPQWLDEFEEEMGDVIEVLGTNEYTQLFDDWMESKSIEDNI